MKEQKHMAGGHAGEKPQVRREAHMRERVSEHVCKEEEKHA